MSHQCNTSTRTNKCLYKEVMATKPSTLSDVNQSPSQWYVGTLSKMENRKVSSKYSGLAPQPKHQNDLWSFFKPKVQGASLKNSDSIPPQ